MRTIHHWASRVRRTVERLKQQRKNRSFRPHVTDAGATTHRTWGLSTLDRERERWFLWVPVFFGAGIGLFFALPHDPPLTRTLAALVAAIALQRVFRRGVLMPALIGATLCMLAGMMAGTLRAEWTRAPVLNTEITARMAAGFIEALEPRLPKGARITMRLRALQGVSSAERPERIRFVWAGTTDLRVGDAITVRLSLRPPPTPVRPGGYDFARRAWFKRIGAVGFAVAEPKRSRTLPTKPDFLGFRTWLGNIRSSIAHRVETQVPGDAGAIINALIIGQRGKVPEEKLDHLRRSGLSHMLAISGLHMAMIAGALFWLLRGGLAAIPHFALNWRIKKGAAITALLGGILYLAVSGASVATQRAAIMIGLMLVAILLDRPALSLRNVALAALIILAIAPENLLEIGFQMSFAAVAALVSFYEWWQARQDQNQVIRSQLITNPIALAALRGSRNMIGGTLMTTLIAGIAVAPFGAFHFHKIAQFSLLANLLAMPVFTVLVMPMALVTLLTLPFGLEGGSLNIMAWGVEAVSDVAAWVALQPDAVRTTPEMPMVAFLAMIIGGLWFCLWRQRWRILGVIPMALGATLSAGTVPPDLLIAREGALIAARTDGQLLSGSPGRAGAFELARWLEADGDKRAADTIVRGAGFRCDAAGCTTQIGDVVVAMPRAPQNIDDDCRKADIVILIFDQVHPCPSARLVIDRADLRREGVHAVTIRPGGAITVKTVEQLRGTRPWTRSGQVQRQGQGQENTRRRHTDVPRRPGNRSKDQ